MSREPRREIYCALTDSPLTIREATSQTDCEPSIEIAGVSHEDLPILTIAHPHTSNAGERIHSQSASLSSSGREGHRARLRLSHQIHLGPVCLRRIPCGRAEAVFRKEKLKASPLHAAGGADVWDSGDGVHHMVVGATDGHATDS